MTQPLLIDRDAVMARGGIPVDWHQPRGRRPDRHPGLLLIWS